MSVKAQLGTELEKQSFAKLAARLGLAEDSRTTDSECKFAQSARAGRELVKVNI